MPCHIDPSDQWLFDTSVQRSIDTLPPSVGPSDQRTDGPMIQLPDKFTKNIKDNTAYLRIRVNPEDWRNLQRICIDLNISTNDAIGYFLKTPELRRFLEAKTGKKEKPNDSPM